MFKKNEALSSKKHQDFRFVQTNSFEFAKSTLSAPLGVSEFFIAARYYPIVFPINNTVPIALFALTQKTNSYLNSDGRWKVPYIPAHIRRYPFILATTNTENSGAKFVVCIDADAPHFATDQGEPLFTADGDPADITKKTMTFLQKIQEEGKRTEAVCKALESQDLLVERKIALEKNGQKSTVGGFRCVDIEKLKKLEDSVLAKWVRNGLMELIYIHQQSLNNLKALG